MSSLAWPVAVVILLLAFRQPIGRMVERLPKRLKAGPVEVESPEVATEARVVLATSPEVKASGPCQDFHVKLFFGGRFVVSYAGGTQEEFGAGDIGVLEPGHDAWVEGDEPVVFIDLGELIKQAGGSR